MTKLILTVVLLLASTAHAYEFPLVMLRSGGDYNVRSYITTHREECSRIVNFSNVAMIRLVNTKELIIDGHLTIAFCTPEERNNFLSQYRCYISKPVPKKWWEF